MLMTNFQEKELSRKCPTLELERLLVAVAATVCQEPHFWTRLRVEGQCISVLGKISP